MQVASAVSTLVAFAAAAYAAVISGAVSSRVHTKDPQISRTAVSTVETNLSHFVPQMLSEAREIEREAMAMGFEDGRGIAAASPTAAVTVDLFVDEKLSG